jgi:hypothetical protein
LRESASGRSSGRKPYGQNRAALVKFVQDVYPELRRAVSGGTTQAQVKKLVAELRTELNPKDFVEEEADLPIGPSENDTVTSGNRVLKLLL